MADHWLNASLEMAITLTLIQPLTRTRIAELVAADLWSTVVVLLFTDWSYCNQSTLLQLSLVSNLIPPFPNPCLQLTVLLFTVKIKIFPYGNWKVNAKLQSNLPMTLIIDAETTQLCLLFWPRKWAYKQHLWLSLTVMCMYKYLHTFLCLSMDHMLAITHNYWVYVYLDDLHMHMISYKCSKILIDLFHKIKMRGWNNYIYIIIIDEIIKEIFLVDKLEHALEAILLQQFLLLSIITVNIF